MICSIISYKIYLKIPRAISKDSKRTKIKKKIWADIPFFVYVSMPLGINRLNYKLLCISCTNATLVAKHAGRFLDFNMRD